MTLSSFVSNEVNVNSRKANADVMSSFKQVHCRVPKSIVSYRSGQYYAQGNKIGKKEIGVKLQLYIVAHTRACSLCFVGSMEIHQKRFNRVGVETKPDDHSISRCRVRYVIITIKFQNGLAVGDGSVRAKTT